MKKSITLTQFEKECSDLALQIRKIDKFAILDGIINTKKYFELGKTGKPRILWILKEPNSKDYIDSNETWDYQDLLSKARLTETENYNIPTFRRVFYCSYAILKDFITWRAIPHISNDYVFEVAEKIAYINISKMPAFGSSYPKALREGFEQFRDIIKEQIIVYNPDIVIFGNTKQFMDESIYNPNNLDVTNCGDLNGTEYFQIDKTLFIKAYHPSVRAIHKIEEDYCNEIISIVRDWWKK